MLPNKRHAARVPLRAVFDPFTVSFARIIIEDLLTYDDVTQSDVFIERASYAYEDDVGRIPTRNYLGG